MSPSSSLFDSIRVKSAGSARGGAKGSKARVCAAADCNAPATHRGPKRNAEDADTWFCADHIKEINAKFNFFDGMSDSAIRAELRANQYGHRKTRPLNEDPKEHGVEARIERAFRRSVWNGSSKLDEGEQGNAPPGASHRLANAPPAVRRALDTIGLPPRQATPQAIKERFRDLVKQLHPDANGNLPHAAEQLRKVIDAHALLRKSGYC